MNTTSDAGRLKAAIYVFLLLAIAAFSASCSRSSDKAVVENAVKEYNTALSQAYRDADITYMNPYATKEQIHRLISIIQPLRKDQRSMRIVQESFEVEYVMIEGDSAEVVAREKWTFWSEDRNTLEAVTPKSTEAYRIIYSLKKHDGKWVVDSLNNS